MMIRNCILALVFYTFFITYVFANAPIDAEGELEDFSGTLKAAVMSGAMSQEDAIKAYFIIAERLGRGIKEANSDKKGASSDKKGASKDSKKQENQKRSFNLNTPSPLNVEALLQPEFLRRDLLTISEDMGLDKTQQLILEAILENYEDSFNTVIVPLQQALQNYERDATNRWLSDVLGNIAIPDAIDAENSIREQMAEWRVSKDLEEDNEALQEFEERLLTLTRNMDERLDALRMRVATDISMLENIDVTSSDLLTFAKKLRDDREQLRLDFIQSMYVILLKEQHGENDALFNNAISSQQIQNLLNHGIFSGDSMDLWSAISQVDIPVSEDGTYSKAFTHAKTVLKNRVADIATLLNARLQATIDREIAGLELQIHIDTAGDTSKVNQLASTKFENSIRRETASSIKVRNSLLILLEESLAGCKTQYDQELLSIYRTASFRQGFPQEMRKRWCEIATDMALKIKSLDATIVEGLNVIDEEMTIALIDLQKEAISKRIEYENELADSQFEPKKEKNEKQFELRLGMNYDEFEELNRNVEIQIESMLTIEQFETIPTLIQRDDKSNDEKKSSKAKAKE